MPDSLVQSLPAGPLDIVGDVHGEMDALMLLLGRLGYSDQGQHPDGRKLVFVGDLTDRGPDSLAVVEFVRRCVEQELAQCVLGNHDLNILLGRRKYDNGWFFGEEFRGATGAVVPQRLAAESDRQQILDFFGSLPLGLHREGLRVVHAHWHEEAIATVADYADAQQLHDDRADKLEVYAQCNNLSEVEKELAHQNDNPVKLLTSGPEQEAAKPFESSGKVRLLERVSWWETYDDDAICVFGHYSLDAAVSRHQSRAICVDFGAYKRRASDRPYKLAALQVPELQIVCDDGMDIQLTP